MTTPNVPLLRAVVDQILAEPDLHHQEEWAVETECGTAYCVGGWACVLGGVKIFHRADWLPGDGTDFTEDGRLISNVARELLGINIEDADVLFGAENDVADIKGMVDRLCAGEHLTSDPWSE